MTEVQEKQRVFAIVEYLQRLIAKGAGDEENLEVAAQCLSEAFGIDLADEDHRHRFSTGKATFEEIFDRGLLELGEGAAASGAAGDEEDLAQSPLFKKFLANAEAKGFFSGTTKGTPEYEERYAKAVAKFREKYQARQQAQEESKRRSAETRAAAEELKAEGNKHLSAQRFEEALAAYTRAAELCPDGPTSHIFFANRAAALSYLRRHEEAIDACKEAIKRDSSYAKAHSRLGYAYFHTERFADAVDSYRRALQLNPDNASAREYLRAAEERLGAADGGSAGSNGVGLGQGGGGGQPDLAAMMNDPNMMGQASSMMQNPAVMQMAQQVMQNPKMMQSLMQSLGGGGGGDGGGGGGGPDLSALLGSLGGMGGAPGASAPASAPAEPSYSASPSVSEPAPAPGGAPGGMPDLSNLANNPRLQALRHDPELADFFHDLEAEGMSGAMRHMSNPAVMNKIMGAMSGSQ